MLLLVKLHPNSLDEESSNPNILAQVRRVVVACFCINEDFQGHDAQASNMVKYALDLARSLFLEAHYRSGAAWDLRAERQQL